MELLDLVDIDVVETLEIYCSRSLPHQVVSDLQSCCSNTDTPFECVQILNDEICVLNLLLAQYMHDLKSLRGDITCLEVALAKAVELVMECMSMERVESTSFSNPSPGLLTKQGDHCCNKATSLYNKVEARLFDLPLQE